MFYHSISTVLLGILGKMNNLYKDSNSYKTLANIFLLQEYCGLFNSVKTLDLIFSKLRFCEMTPLFPYRQLKLYYTCMVPC